RSFSYDGSFNPQSVTDSLGTLSSFLFNPNGTLQAGAVGYDLTQQPAQASQFTYDAFGNMTSRTDALGRTTSYTYNNLGQKTTMTIPLPNSSTSTAAATTSYQYDALGNLVETDAPLGRTTKSTYDANGNKLSDTDARGNVTTYQYDALNRLTTTTYPTQPATTSTRSYDFRNNVIDEIDQAGHDIHYSYDLAGRLSSVTQGYGTSSAATTSYTYDNNGRRLTQTDPNNNTTTWAYDSAGNLLSVSGAQGNFQYGYDNARNRVSMTDGDGHVTQYSYDARKRLVITTYPDGTRTTNAYDGPGNLISVTDQANNVVQYTYDAANQLRSVVQINGPSTGNNTNHYGFDNDGNLISLGDENGHSTQYSFDLFNERTSTTLPDGSLTESRTYDANGNLQALTHFSGVTTTYAYDPMNRLLSRTPDARVNEPTVSFTYTTTGKRASMTDASGTTSYTYDSLDRLTQKSTPEGTLTYTYDSAGNLASMTSADGIVSVDYTWDNLNRLSTVTDNKLGGSADVTTYTYDNASNLATVTYPNTLQSTFQYDKENRLTSMTAGSTAAYGYTLGPTGNRTNVMELSGRSATWSFDGIYRLTGETVTGDSQYNGSVSYGLDPVGNRLSQSSGLHGISSLGFSYNADDQIMAETYDLNGNTTATGGKAFAFNSENQLISMNGSAVTMIYDGDGNRVAKTASGSTTRYLVDDLNPTGYAQVVEETTNGAGTREYTYGLQRIDEDQIVNNAWMPSFYGYDGFGTVRQLTSLTGAVTDSYEYDAFGNQITHTGTTPNNYLYRGEQFDSDLGLYYLRARYYNPQTGRFMSRDPNDGDIKIPATLHKYLFASGDPVDGMDPTGRATYYNPAYKQQTLGDTFGEYLGILNNISLRAFVFTQVVIPVYLASDQGRRAIYVLLAGTTLAVGIACEFTEIWTTIQQVGASTSGVNAHSPPVSCVDQLDSRAGDTGGQQ
ncbi:MAG: RHS repeat-associated core domain-containing protein, partial [Acidobacteriota bacterium]